MKKIIFVFTFFTLFIPCFSESAKVKFLKGNIADKTNAIKESSAEDSIWLANKAIQFAIENKELLGNDRELDALVVSAILTITPDFIDSADTLTKNDILFNLTNLFKLFDSSYTVQISILSKISLLKDIISTNTFTDELHNFLYNSDPSKIDSGLFKACTNTLSEIGNNISFNLLFSFYNDKNYTNFKSEIENTLISLAPSNIEEILYVINEASFEQIQPLFQNIVKKSQISKNFLCEIAENLLNSSIVLVENSSSNKDEIIKIQIEALEILSKNNWTRSSASAIAFFNSSKKEFDKNTITEQQMIFIIESLINISPIESISPLVSYLVELNSLTEMGKSVSIPVVEAVIKTLGAIGNKSAFDSLLGVTYLNYPESVLSAAREALAGLKW